MYDFYALRSNEDAVIELAVKKTNHFVRRKYEVLSWLSNFTKCRSGRICGRNYDSDHTQKNAVPNAWRFLEVPHVVTKYTYMADVDIFLMESVLDPKRFKHMYFYNIPYRNSIRQNTTRVTGVMLADT